MNIEQAYVQNVSYFAFKPTGIGRSIKRERLNTNDPDNNIEARLKQIKDGQNIFEAIPELKRAYFEKYAIDFCEFQTREEALINGESFVSIKGYRRQGELLIPHYNVIAREDIRSPSADKLLAENPNTAFFYGKRGNVYHPINLDNEIIISKEQLE